MKEESKEPVEILLARSDIDPKLLEDEDPGGALDVEKPRYLGASLVILALVLVAGVLAMLAIAREERETDWLKDLEFESPRGDDARLFQKRLEDLEKTTVRHQSELVALRRAAIAHEEDVEDVIEVNDLQDTAIDLLKEDLDEVLEGKTERKSWPASAMAMHMGRSHR